MEICILAGGLSRRMGRDKSRLRIGRRTMLGHIRAAANQTGLPLRVIRRDAIPRCGPLGGIFTALSTTRMAAVLFLACDMPFITPELLKQVIRRFHTGRCSLFSCERDQVGFPFILPNEALPIVEENIRRRTFSLQSLAGRLEARRLRWPPGFSARLRNVNTPVEWKSARECWRRDANRAGRTSL